MFTSIKDQNLKSHYHIKYKNKLDSVEHTTVDIVAFSSCHELDRYRLYFRHFIFCQKERFLPLSRNFPSKSEFFFCKIETAKGILIYKKKEFTFSRGNFQKGGKILIF